MAAKKFYDEDGRLIRFRTKAQELAYILRNKPVKPKPKPKPKPPQYKPPGKKKPPPKAKPRPIKGKPIPGLKPKPGKPSKGKPNFGGYVAKHKDLAEAYKKHKAKGGKGTAAEWGKRHYEKHGKKEKRKLS